jgi:lipopolysaccharide transport system permease protein
VIGRLWAYRFLIAALVTRNYKLRYRQSLAGLGWAIVPPLATLGVGVLVFDRVADVGPSGVPYPIFALAGLVPWTFFASGLTFGVSAVEGELRMLARFAFPRAALPLSAVGLSLIDLASSLFIFILFAFALGQPLPPTALLFPALVLVEVVLVSGIVLLGSALNVFARDVRLAVPLLVQVWLFITPVLYPLEEVPDALRPWYLANPMTGLVESFRDVLVFGRLPELELLWPAVAGAILAFLIGYWYFASTEQRFADVV